MDIKETAKNWERFAQMDPLWAILTEEDFRGGKWPIGEFFRTGRAWAACLMNQLYQNLMEPERFDSALDFGCGVGRITQALTPYFRRVEGVDVSPTMIERAKTFIRLLDRNDTCQFRLIPPGIKLSLYENRTFCFVHSFLTLQHMEPRFMMDYIADFMRILTPGGVAAFQVPEPARQEYGGIPVGTQWEEGGPIMEMWGIPKEIVLEVLKKSGASHIVIIDENSKAAFPSWLYLARK